MADIINLNKARKRKVRADAAQQADENRIRYGRTKSQREADAAAAIEAQRRLDLLKRETEPQD